MTETTPTLTDEQRDLLLAPCVCGHTINDHGGYVACWLCEDEGGECHTPFEAMLAERIARMVADAERRGRAAALRSPYGEDGYCEGCGNGSWKPHAPECGWADLHDAEQRGRAEGWDERSKARPQYLGPLDGHYPDCMGYGDCYCGTYPNPYQAVRRDNAAAASQIKADEVTRAETIRIKAEALREAADDWGFPFAYADNVRYWLRTRADEVTP